MNSLVIMSVASGQVCRRIFIRFVAVTKGSHFAPLRQIVLFCIFDSAEFVFEMSLFTNFLRCTPDDGLNWPKHVA